jgi:LuxR family maltose regulon positive regulatory protein
MPVPILETKLYIAPVRPEMVQRPALLERLSAGLGRKLTLVSAPAGSGKSTLVSAWLLGGERRYAWLSLDEGDNDTVRFVSHLVAAVSMVHGDVGRDAQRLLEASASPPIETLVSMLINDIAGDVDPFVLVLDDYHTITELTIHDAVGFLLDRQPPEMHLVIITRHDPPLPLSRLRGRGQVTEIRQDDLRFSDGEATAFLTQAMGLQLSDAHVAALQERTEGWITGLQLAALSMQGRDPESVARFIEGFSGRHHFVLDYLTDEVLKRQPRPLQEFLLHTSVLERMSGPLCDALLDPVARGAPGRETLQRLDAANLFVVPLDDERTWYRYHNLFAELLRARLQEAAAHHVPELHRRAAAWYEENGFAADAVRHALATGDDPLAAGVIERQIMKMGTWSRVDVTMLLRWLQAVPDSIMRSRPWLWLFTFRTMFSAGQMEASMHLLDELEEALRANPALPDAQRVLQLAAADRASLAATRGDIQQALAAARRYQSQLQEGDTMGRVRAAATLGMAYYRAGDMAQARSAFAEAIDLVLAADMPVVAVPLMCNLAAVQTVQGQLGQALATCKQAEQTGMADGRRIATAGFAALVLGEILYERNDLQAAERYLLDGLALLTSGGIAEQFGNLHSVLAQVKQAQGDQGAAQQSIERAVQIAQGGNIPRLVHRVLAHRARIWLAQGKLDQAVEWAREYQQLGDTEYLREFEDLTLARVLLAEHKPDESLALLDPMLAQAQHAGRLGSVIQIQASRAVALLALGDRDQALAALESALTMARPEGYVRSFVDHGEPMRALLKRAASRGMAPAYVARLLAAYDWPSEVWAQHPAAHLAPRTPVDQPLVEPLSAREMEVLHLLAKGRSNKEIAQTLYISLPTVKSHTRSIYGKLGVHSRKEAVARARGLGILPTA